MNTVKVIRAFGLKVWFVGDLFGNFTVNLAKCVDTGRFVKIAVAVERLKRMVVCGMTTQVRDDMRHHVAAIYATAVKYAKVANSGKAAAHKKVESLLSTHAEMVQGMAW